jgi:polysaccharide biosynthesis transport protein
MVPGRRYNARYFVRTVRRSWWMLVAPLAVTGSIAIVIAKTLPDVYHAQGIVRIVPPRVPDTYVRGTVILSVPERVAAARAQVLTPDKLTALINEFDIYPTMRHRVPAEVVNSWLRSSIKINVVSADIFTVGYFGYSRTRVEKVAERLTAMMTEEVEKQRTSLTENQGQFLETELETARKRLEEHEQKVSEYRRRYQGQLPTQVEANLRMLQGASSELTSTEEALNRDRTQRDQLTRELDAAAAVEPALPPGDLQLGEPQSGNPTAATPQGSPVQRLKAARTLRAQLARRFTPEHPDMQSLDRYISQLEIAMGSMPAPADPNAGGTDAPTRVAQLRGALKTVEGQIATREAASKRLRDAIATYRARVDAVPEREAEWMKLTRDYNTFQGVYTNLLAKREESRIAANIDRQAVGEQLVVLEKPRRPNAPVSPNRRAVALIGVGIGVAVGVGFLLIRELRDRTIRAEEEVLAALNLPVVGLVPRIVTAVERRQLRRRRLLWSFAALALCVGLAALRWNG